MTKTPIAIALERQIPEHIREEYATFVQFVKAYYEFLEQTQQRNLEDIRSLDNTLDEFVFKFKKELSALFPATGLEDERFLLQRIREFYRSRGSEESFKFLFRAFFNKDAEIYYPSKQVLRASSGQWIQEKSIFLKVDSGKNAFDLNGKIITIITSRKHINVYSPRVRYYSDGVYEVFIDRAYISDISIGEAVQLNGVKYGTILPCPSKYTIVAKGSGFSVGSIFTLEPAPVEVTVLVLNEETNQQEERKILTKGTGSVIKITKVNSLGGIERVQPISFGLDYKTTFFAKLSNSTYKALEYFHPLSAATIGAGHPEGLFPASTFTRTSGFYGDTTTGYLDYGYIIRNEYFGYQAGYTGADNIVDLDPYFGYGDYVGEIIGEFYTNASNNVVIDSSVAQIMIDLGAVAVYPGYYNSTDGFISDEIYIQDGKYYQSFSYVIKVEEQLNSYIDMIKSLLHPAGYELFAQYNIKNDFIVSTVPLDAFVRYQFFDRAFVADFSPIPLGGILNIGQSKQDNVQLTEKLAPDNYPTEIKRYSELYVEDIAGNVTLSNSTSSGSDGYFSDYGLAAQINRNQNQSDSLKNNWDIVLGNQNPALGSVAPLIGDFAVTLGNFEDRVLGSADILGVEKLTASFAGTSESLAPSGSPTNIKRYSVLLNVDSAGNYTIGTPTGIDGQLSDYSTTTESYVGGNFRSTSGLEWSFSGDTWKDTQAPIAYHNLEWATATAVDAFGNIIPNPFDFKERTQTKLYENYVNALEDFDRSNATSSSVAYNRSTVPLEQTNVTSAAYHNYAWSTAVVNGVPVPYDFKDRTISMYSTLINVDSGGNLTMLSPNGIPGQLNEYATSSESLTKLEFAKYKQPQLLGFTANITAGSREIVFTTGYVVNTMIGLKAIKITGTGAFAANAIVDAVDTINNKLLLSANHVTSGTIVFYVEASSTEAEITDLAVTVTAVNGSGLGWAFAGATFNQTVNIQELYTPFITYNRSTVPLEQTSVVAINGEMNWDLTYYAMSSAVNFANIVEQVSLKAIEKGTSANPIPETVTTVNGGMNWEFSGATFAEPGPNIGYSLQVNSAAHDLTFTSAAAATLLKLTVNGAASNEAEQLLMNFFNTTELLATTQAQFYPFPQSGYKYGDISESNDIGSYDALVLSKFVLNDTITVAEKTKIERLLGKLALFGPSYLNTLITGGLITSTKKINIVRTIEDNINTIINTGTLYYNPYNIDTDATTAYSYNTGGSYFVSDTRAL